MLDSINQFEDNYNHHIKVILAKILNRQIYQDWMTQKNNNIESLAYDYISEGDDIVLVDMENGAGINYDTDFEDTTHPNRSGYRKMAVVWFNAIKKDLPKKNYSYLVPIVTSLLN